MEPSEVLKHLKSISSSRSHETLDAIFEVCTEQVERGIIDFSIATISRLGHKRGVPRAQSIRNKTGENYRTLIQSFISGLPKSKSPSKPKASNAWIDDIKDLKLRLLVQIQASQLAEAQRIVKEIIPPGFEVRVDDRGAFRAEQKLNAVERRALEYLISEDFLRQWNYTLGEFGDIVDSSNSKVFKPGTVDAVRKALESL